MTSAAPKKVSSTVGERLAAIRGDQSQPARADAFGVHKNTYARWERDEASMPAEAIQMLVAEGWNANWVLTGNGPARLNGSGSAEHRDVDNVTESSKTSQPLSERNLTIALELGDEAARRAGWAPKAEIARIVIEAYQALAAGATYTELWQDLQDEFKKSEPGGVASSGSQQEEARDVRRRSSGTGRKR